MVGAGALPIEICRHSAREVIVAGITIQSVAAMIAFP
jgi:hypothetical protein